MDENRPPICDYEGSDYQTRFWEEANREYEDRVEQIALQRLLPSGGNRLLEIGAGAGRNTPRYHNFQHIILLDYSLTQLQQARERLGESPRLIYVAGNAYRLPFTKGVFDCATMIRTLHHMADVPAVFQQIRRVMAHQGVFILEYANKRHLKAIGRYLLGLQDWSPFSLQPVEFVELNFDFHPRYIKRELEQAAFEINRKLSVSHFRIELLKRLIPPALLARLDAAVQHTGRWWQLSPSVFMHNTAVGNEFSQSPAAKMLSLFQCPACGRSPLKEESDHMLCPGCSTAWPIREGIYDFREKNILPDRE